MNIPEGYALVPVEPTEKMVRNGDMNYSWSVAKIYKAMAAAAPPVELPAYDEAKELAECRSQWEKNPNCLFSDMWIGWKACAKSRARSAE